VVGLLVIAAFAALVVWVIFSPSQRPFAAVLFGASLVNYVGITLMFGLAGISRHDAGSAKPGIRASVALAMDRTAFWVLFWVTAAATAVNTACPLLLIRSATIAVAAGAFALGAAQNAIVAVPFRTWLYRIWREKMDNQSERVDNTLHMM